MAGLVLIGRKLGDTWARGQGDTIESMEYRVWSMGRGGGGTAGMVNGCEAEASSKGRPDRMLRISVCRRANKGRGTIHRALRLGGRGGATPLPSAALRRPPANFPVSGFPLSSWKMNRPVPAPEPEQLNQAPDGRDLRPVSCLSLYSILHTRYSQALLPTPYSKTIPPLPQFRPCPSHS